MGATGSAEEGSQSSAKRGSQSSAKRGSQGSITADSEASVPLDGWSRGEAEPESKPEVRTGGSAGMTGLAGVGCGSAVARASATDEKGPLSSAQAASPHFAGRDGGDAAAARGDTELYTFREIGRCASVFPNKRGVPRQGVLAQSTLGRVRLHRHMGPPCLEGLSEYSHVWLVFVFSRNANEKKVQQWLAQDEKLVKSFPSKIRPPLLGGRSTGIYSTRTPHRPNPIGLTLVSLISVDMNAKELVVGGLDLCHDTPILDIKPFVPGDVPHPAQPVRYAPWVQAEDGVVWSVEASQHFTNQLEDLVSKGATTFYKDVATLLAAIKEILQLDVRSIHQGRGKNSPPRPVQQQCAIDGVQVHFLTHVDTKELVLLTANAYTRVTYH